MIVGLEAETVPLPSLRSGRRKADMRQGYCDYNRVIAITKGIVISRRAT